MMPNNRLHNYNLKARLQIECESRRWDAKMKFRLSYLLISVAVLFAPFAAEARTVDGTMNMDEIPSLSLTQAMVKAVSGLGANAHAFLCTSAWSKTRQSGGGWAFTFQSRTHKMRHIRINANTVIVANNDASTKGGQFKNAPSLSVEKVPAMVTADRKDAAAWIALGLVWIEERDEWQVSLLNNQKKTITVIVDAKGKTKELHPNQASEGIPRKLGNPQG